LKTISKVGVGALVLMMGASLLAMRPHTADRQQAAISAAHRSSPLCQRIRAAISIIACSTRGFSS